MEQRFTVRMAMWSARNPWRAMAGWLVFVVACLVLGSLAGTRSADSVDYRAGEAGRAEAIADDAGILDPLKESVVITPRSGAELDAEAADAAAKDVAARMKGAPSVSEVGDPERAPGGQAVLVPLTMKGEDAEISDDIPALLERTAAVQKAHPGLEIAQTGHFSMGMGVSESMGEDLATAERITLPLTLVILMVVFGAVVAAGVPVLIALSAVGAAMGLSQLFSHLFPSVGANNSLILLMGMAVGVDYSLLFIKRVREERARSGGRLDQEGAVRVAATTAGHTVMVAGFAVMVSLAALFVVGDVVFSSLAISSITVVAIVMTASLTVLPALLVKLGRAIDRPKLPFLGRIADRSAGSPETGRMWPRLLGPAMRRPAASLVIGLLVIAGLSLPALGMQLSSTEVSTLPKVTAVKARDRLVEQFPSQGASYLVAVKTDQAHRAELPKAMDALVDAAHGQPLLRSQEPAETEVSADGRTGTVLLHTPYALDSDEAQQTLELLREELVPATVGAIDTAETGVSGDVARNADVLERQMDALPLVIGAVLVLSLVVMLVAFRSVPIAIVSTLLSVISAAGALGLLVLVFQSDRVQDMLGYDADGFIVSRVPLFLFVILFGLSTDYNVFMVSRIKEAMQKGRSTSDALLEGIAKSAGVVTGGALVMVSVFASFMFTNLLEMKQLGFGLCAAVLIDVVLVRIVILPAMLKLLAPVLWWPDRRVAARVADAPVGEPVSAPQQVR
ncbi:MMPL family transporter [Streptomyces sp. C11-1]|uniref:MMPL family transporter n=1 Tax=Streptomyces durocortorensis TaxID=2811104 RepID=A0ABY9VVP3_9ACTN|nr:MMPL family transporter [Streptomyces durocortorensis]WNF27999.1 MMPL family transporter [Streptomyces durocortorensis]